MPPVRQSASKEEFLKALNLDTTNQEDRTKFAMMWEEVTRYWVQNFEIEQRHILKPEYLNNPGVKKPYKWAHLSPQYIDKAIVETWTSGGEWPRKYYDQGKSDDPKVFNWVLKWLFWHVCRYRDWRNRKNRPSSASSSSIQVELELDSNPPEHDYWQTVMDGRP